MEPPHHLLEKLALGTAGLLASALVFLGDYTVHYSARIAAVLLLLLALLACGVVWLRTVPPDEYPRRAIIPAVALVGAAFTFATLGYVLTALEGRARSARTAYSELDVSPERAAATETRMQRSIPWFGLAILAGIGSIAMFARGRRVAGTALAAAAISLTGWKVVEVESLVKEVKLAPKFSLTSNSEPSRPPDKPASSPPAISLLASVSIGPFESGRAAIDDALSRQVLAGRHEAERLGQISYVTIVGHVDRRALVRTTARMYGSNQGLAIQRASAVQDLLSDLPTTISAGGPRHTQEPVNDPDLASDRCVVAYFFGVPTPSGS